MISVTINPEEPLEKGLSRFKRSVMKEGIVSEVRRRQYFVKPSALKHERTKKLKRKAALKLRKKKSYLSDK